MKKEKISIAIILILISTIIYRFFAIDSWSTKVSSLFIIAYGLVAIFQIIVVMKKKADRGKEDKNLDSKV